MNGGFEGYEKEGKPIKDFQGMTAKIEGSVGAFGVGISGEIDTKMMIRCQEVLE